jgi:ribosomal protein S18 acetylase RimI-like enzyme
MVMIEADDIRLLEELNFNAWPALRTMHYDGWLLRCSGGQSRRVNSVNPVKAGMLDLESKIAEAEAIYQRWGRKAVFRLTPLADEGLERKLAARGYVIEAPSFVQLAEARPCSLPRQTLLFEHASADWLDAALEMRGLPGKEADVFRAQHEAVGVQARWALVREGERNVGVGVVAVERGWAGLHGIYVVKDARRRGIARVLSEGLIGSAHALGARRVWLQVEQGNAPALPLYAALGFTTAYSYHHRIMPSAKP